MRATGGGTLRPEKTGNEQEQLDEILKELLGDQMNLRDNAPATRHPSTPGTSLVPAVTPTRGTITTESDNMRTQLSWQTSQAGPTKSAMVARQTVAQPYPSAKVESDSMRYREMTASQRSPREVEIDKWGASERYAYEAPRYHESRRVETHSETVRREEIIDQASQRQYLSTGEPLTSARTPSPYGAGPRAEPLMLPSSSSPRHSTPYREEYMGSQVPREPTRRTVSDYRLYASDSEEPMSWLEEQRSKLRTRTGRPWKQRSPHEKQLVAELKSAQSAYYTTKRGVQSDTEDGATFDRYGRSDRRGYPRYGPAHSLDEPTLDDTLTRSYAREQERRTPDPYQYNYETKSRIPGPQLSSTRYTFSTGPSYRPPVGLARSSAPTSPVIPERGDSSREAVLRSQTSAREWLKSSGQ